MARVGKRTRGVDLVRCQWRGPRGGLCGSGKTSLVELPSGEQAFRCEQHREGLRTMTFGEARAEARR